MKKSEPRSLVKRRVRIPPDYHGEIEGNAFFRVGHTYNRIGHIGVPFVKTENVKPSQSSGRNSDLSQGQLWHDTVLDAVVADIQASGGFKAVGPLLYPEHDPGTAANKLRNATNPDQPHKLCLLELVLVLRKARDAGSVATLNYLAHELACEVNVLAPAEAKKRAKKARVSALLAELARLSEDE